MSLIVAMFLFALAMSISPGPVNMIIVSSGINYGVKKTFSFVSGATIGFTLLLLFVGLGFYQVVNAYPIFLKYLAVAGSAFIIYIGYMIASSNPEFKVEEQNVPTFFQWFLLQWLNPKAWIASVSGVSMFSVPDSNGTFLIFTAMYFFVCYMSLFSWSILGYKAAIIFNNEFRLRIFNRFMGSLLIATACYLLYVQLT